MDRGLRFESHRLQSLGWLVQLFFNPANPLVPIIRPGPKARLFSPGLLVPVQKPRLKGVMDRGLKFESRVLQSLGWLIQLFLTLLTLQFRLLDLRLKPRLFSPGFLIPICKPGLKGVMDLDKKNPICTSGSGRRPCLQHHWRWHMRLRAIRDHDQGRAQVRVVCISFTQRRYVGR